MKERRVAAQRPECGHHQRAGPEPDHRALYLARAECQSGEHEHRRADVLTMQMNAVASRIVAQHTGELGEIRVENFLRWQRIRDRVLPSLVDSAWRPWDVFHQWPELNGAAKHADRDGDGCQHEPPYGQWTRELMSRRVGRQRQVQRVRTAHQQQVLQELRMRREDSERDRHRQRTPCPRSAITHTAVHEEQHQRQQRCHENLAVMPR